MEIYIPFCNPIPVARKAEWSKGRRGRGLTRKGGGRTFTLNTSGHLFSQWEQSREKNLINLSRLRILVHFVSSQNRPARDIRWCWIVNIKISLLHSGYFLAFTTAAPWGKPGSCLRLSWATRRWGGCSPGSGWPSSRRGWGWQWRRPWSEMNKIKKRFTEYWLWFCMYLLSLFLGSEVLGGELDRAVHQHSRLVPRIIENVISIKHYNLIHNRTNLCVNFS